MSESPCHPTRPTGSNGRVDVALPRSPIEPPGGADPDCCALDRSGTGLDGGAAPFVGRQRELAEIDLARTAVAKGTGRLLLLFGQPGAGKTRLAREALVAARGAGWETMVGRCPEGEGIPVFAPWAQIVRELVDERAGDATVTDALESSAADLSRVVPELRERFPDLTTHGHLEPTAERYRLFDAGHHLLRAITRARPAFLVIDDLHAADRDSLQMLKFVAHQLSGTRLLIVGTYRDRELMGDHPFSAVLADLLREPNVSQIPVGSLCESDVREFITRVTGRAADRELAGEVFRRTDGNAFFVTEVVRMLIAEGVDAGAYGGSTMRRVPPGAREVLRRRLGVLSVAARDVLSVGALLGREFRVGLLERMTQIARRELLRLLDEAITAGMLLQTVESPRAFRIAHALLRDTLYEELGEPRRAELHQRAAELIEESLSGASGPRYVELSHHYQRSDAEASPAKAYSYAVLAARHCSSQLAFEEAIEHLRCAIGILESGSDARNAALGDLWLELGQAATSAGQPAVARDAFGRAGRIARQGHLPIILARAALGMSGPVIRFGTIDHDAVSLLELALEHLPGDERELRAHVLVRLAIEIQSMGQTARRTQLADESAGLAEHLGDVRLLAEVIGERRNRLRLQTNLQDRLAEADDLVRRAEEVRDVGAALDGRSWRIQDLLELGDIHQVRQEMATFGALARQLRAPLYAHRAIAHDHILALLEGRLADAERHSLSFLADARQVSEWQASSAFLGQMFTLRRFRGGLEEILEPATRFVEEHPALAAARAGLALGLHDAGRPDDARRQYGCLVGGGLSRIPEDAFWFGTMAFIAELAARLGDTPRVNELHERLAPFAGRNAVIGFGGFLGPVSRLLGLLSTAVRRWDDARTSFDEALIACEHLEELPFRVLVKRDLATMLMHRGDPADRSEVRVLLEDAVRSAALLEMSATLHEARRLLSELADSEASGAAALPSRDARAESPGARVGLFRREGEYWTLGMEERQFRLRDSIGLRCLATLLQQPFRAFLAMDLASAAGNASEGERDVARSGVKTRDPVLDGRAATEYRLRLRELRDALEVTSERGDGSGAERIQEEIDTVAAHLARSLGIRGKTRSAGSQIERARVNVTRTIREAIQRIAIHDAALARHLRAHVRTGTYCIYEPAPTRRLEWQI